MATSRSKCAIRPCTPSDLAAIHAMNVAGTPGVSAETPEALAKILAISTALVAETAAGSLAGFITLIEPGDPRYHSPNLRWFEDWSDRRGLDLVYVDRIAIAPSQRRTGLGTDLYHAAFSTCRGREAIGCEVNLVPDNPASHRFHSQLGFTRVGDQTFDPGGKQVAYYVRSLLPSGQGVTPQAGQPSSR